MDDTKNTPQVPPEIASLLMQLAVQIATLTASITALTAKQEPKKEEQPQKAEGTTDAAKAPTLGSSAKAPTLGSPSLAPPGATLAPATLGSPPSPDSKKKEGQSADAASGPAKALGAVAQTASSGISAMSTSLGSAGGSFQAMGSAIGQASQMLGSVLGPAGAAVGQALGSLVSQIGEAINAVKPFVEALAPGTIMMFDQAMQNLQATVGTAFEPIFQVLTDVFNKVGGMILPVMEALRPVIQQLSESMGGVLLAVVQASVSAFKSMLPFLKLLADILGVWAIQLKLCISVIRLLSLAFEPFRIALMLMIEPFVKAFQIFGGVLEAISEVIDAVSLVFEVLMDTVKGMFGSMDVKDILKSLADATQKVVASFYRLIAQVAKFFGMDTFLKNLIKSLEPTSGQVAAPKNAAVSSVDSVAKEMATAAATASGSAQTDKEASTMDIVNELKAMQGGGDSKFSALMSQVKRIADFITKGVGSETTERLGYNSRGEALADVTGGPGGIINILQRMNRGRRS